MRRVGVFGGTFDPPHLGHLLLAEAIREAFDLAEIYFMPCNEPPHKDRADLTDAKHRFAMVVAATLQNPAFVASSIEVNRQGKSFSVDTVQQLADALDDNTEIVFVTGLDAFVEIETWKNFEQFLDLCHVAVVSRPGHGFEDLKKLPDWIVERSTRVAESSPTEGFPEDGFRVFLSDAVHIDISSTDIRERIARGASIRYMVPAEVERYIRAHGLYRSGPVPREVAS